MALVNRRETFKASILKYSRTIKDFTDETALSELNVYLEGLNSAWSSFQSVHFEILDVTGKEEFEFQNIEYGAVEDVVIKCFITGLLSKFELKGDESESLRLQPMELPEFDGSQLLNVSRQNATTMFESVGNHSIHRPNGIMNIEFMSSRRSPKILPTYPVSTYILPSITNPLPSQKIEMQNWSQFANLQLADLMFNEPKAIDLLLGGDIYPDIMTTGQKKSPHNGLIAHNRT